MKKTDSQRRARIETTQERKIRVGTILKLLRDDFPHPSCALDHHTPLELLIATILSAQCTDERVNMVTPTLFSRFRSAQDFADVDLLEFENIIRPTGFFHAKAKNIKACCTKIVAEYHGQVPRTMEELTSLPGVGRKTANVVLGNAFGIPGLPVDTHVKRIANLLGLTSSSDPDVIETDLTAVIPKKDWTDASHLLILHGRKTCIARRPRCSECRIELYCPSSLLKQFLPLPAKKHGASK